jgi:hypothetical protein
MEIGEVAKNERENAVQKESGWRATRENKTLHRNINYMFFIYDEQANIT